MERSPTIGEGSVEPSPTSLWNWYAEDNIPQHTTKVSTPKMGFRSIRWELLWVHRYPNDLLLGKPPLGTYITGALGCSIWCMPKPCYSTSSGWLSALETCVGWMERAEGATGIHIPYSLAKEELGVSQPHDSERCRILPFVRCIPWQLPPRAAIPVCGEPLTRRLWSFETWAHEQTSLEHWYVDRHLHTYIDTSKGMHDCIQIVYTCISI